MDNKRNYELNKLMKLLQEEQSGLEYDSDYDDVDENAVFSTKDIRVSQKMVTVFMIEHWIQEDILNLQPDYQRNLVWDSRRKSALIESMLLNIPIPAFYFDEENNGKKNVIDGLQRLSAIHEFINNKFELRYLQYLSGCERKKFDELDMRYRTKILESILVINILDERCSPMIKMDIFRRVNTGGVHLNPQEIRNILATAKVRKLFKDMSNCDEFIRATYGRVNDIRMGAQELCLRFITILSSYEWNGNDFSYYQGLLKMMDACVLILNRANDKYLEVLFDQFKDVMRQCHIILGENSFCKLDNKRINKALFTSWAVVLFYYKLSDIELKKKKDDIRQRYFWILENDRDFYDSITSSTGSRRYILNAISVIRSIMEEFYGIKYEND